MPPTNGVKNNAASRVRMIPVLGIGQYLPVLGSIGIGEYLAVFIPNTQE